MGKTAIPAEEIAKVFKEHCRKNNYQIKETQKSKDIRLDVSNFKDKSVVNIYSTSTIQIQGAVNPLKEELEELKRDFEADPHLFLGKDIKKEKACTVHYEIIDPGIQARLKGSWKTIGETEIAENLKKGTLYMAKISRDKLSITITQFQNGTLFLQGKTNALFDDACGIIEEIANPDEKAVIARFISDDEEKLKQFSKKYTPELLTQAEDNIKRKLGEVYDYLYEYDRKYFVASECLCLAGIPLPEYSPFVMPASKGFEGFVKKLTVSIGLFAPDHFKSKTANFAELRDKNHPKRKEVCNKNKYNETYLERLAVAMDMNRNFMMHSDDTDITKIETMNEALEKVNEICKETNEIYKYLKDSINP